MKHIKTEIWHNCNFSTIMFRAQIMFSKIAWHQSSGKFLKELENRFFRRIALLQGFSFSSKSGSRTAIRLLTIHFSYMRPASPSKLWLPSNEVGRWTSPCLPSGSAARAKRRFGSQVAVKSHPAAALLLLLPVLLVPAGWAICGCGSMPGIKQYYIWAFHLSDFDRSAYGDGLPIPVRIILKSIFYCLSYKRMCCDFSFVNFQRLSSSRVRPAFINFLILRGLLSFNDW